jgi:diguanylate cyclase (GGDEF)-like protein/PAS domain S-box-containing protein
MCEAMTDFDSCDDITALDGLSFFAPKKSLKLPSAGTRSITLDAGAATPAIVSTNRFRQMADAMAQIVWTTSPDGAADYFNRRWTEFSGLTLEETRKRGWHDLIHPDDRAEFRQAWTEALAHGTDLEVVYRLRRADGEYRSVLARSIAIRDEAGNILRRVGTATDITARVEAERALIAAHEQTTDILESISEAFYAIDKNFTVTHMNRQAEILWNRRREDILGSNLWAAFPEAVGSVMYRCQVKAMADRQPAQYQTYSPIMLKWVEVSIYPTPTGLSCYWRDISARRQLEKEQERLLKAAVERADCDSLTGLLNHRAFYRRLAEAETARQDCREASNVLVVLDLDSFKFFNEAYGHLAGDEVILSLTTALREGLRSDDVIGRLGGDEFGILVRGMTATDARRLMDRLRAVVSEAGFMPPKASEPIPIVFSYGLAVCPGDAPTVLEAISLADERLLLAKHRNTDDYLVSAAEDLASRIEGFSMLDALVTAVDNKDRYTRKHSDDVFKYSVMIAGEVGLTGEPLETLRIASLLHDVGKIGVPDSLLRRPAELSRLEYEVVKKHAAMGAAIIGAVPELAHVTPAVRHHHEAWNGSGYPDGLAGDTIPLAARIIAVADAYAAMTADRPYRRRRAPGEAVACLRSGAGTQWDSHLVEALVGAVQRDA